MLTIVAIPKRFEGHFGLIQTNAIRSWSLLDPRPEIILLGSDEGTAEMASEVGAVHIPEVVSSPSGAPMLDDVLAKGQRHARHDTVCFINADIVLTPEWLSAAATVRAWRREFLMVGRRWDFDLLQPLDFSQPDWARRLCDDARAHGRMATNMFIDYFLFPRGMMTDIPAFVIGRPGYDNWLLWRIRQRGIALVDATESAPVIHQNHDYSHIKAVRGDPGGRLSYAKGEDTRRNAALMGDWTRSFTTDHATHFVADGRVRPAFRRQYLDARIETIRRHAINVTRPIRRKLGVDEGSVERLRARFFGG